MKCARCLKPYTAGRQVDPCLGQLPGVAAACCGHGADDGYVMFNNGVIIRSAVGFRVDDITMPRCHCDEDLARHWHTADEARQALYWLEEHVARLEATPPSAPSEVRR